MDPNPLTARFAPSCKAAVMERNAEYILDIAGILPITQMTYDHP